MATHAPNTSELKFTVAKGDDGVSVVSVDTYNVFIGQGLLQQVPFRALKLLPKVDKY